MEGIKKTLKIKKLSLTLPLFKKDLQFKGGDMFHTIDGPMQLIHADVADLNFFSKSAVAPKNGLLCVDMFTSKTYTYGMKKRASWQINSEDCGSRTKNQGTTKPTHKF